MRAGGFKVCVRAGGAKSLQIAFWLAVEWLGHRKKERKTKKKFKKIRQSVLVKDRKHCTSLTLSPRPLNELRQERACVRAHFGWLGWGDWSVLFWQGQQRVIGVPWGRGPTHGNTESDFLPTEIDTF